MDCEADDLAARAAYIDNVRRLGRKARTAGFAVCLLGVVLLVLVRSRLGSPAWESAGAIAVIGVGWALLFYSVARRLLYLRVHPFKGG
ncbi:MAG: hypothetical protein ACRED8_09150 [Caulobacteraceae bacterium]